MVYGEGERPIKDYDIPYSAVGKEQHSEDLFLAPTLVLWLSSFVFPNSKGNDIRVETFPMAYQMVKGMRRTVRLSCLSSIYTRLDVLIKKKKSPQYKKGKL